eukprot:CAMPEP_0182869274 /NCGR_PEP_ID=MMETSP0034_2-20130328/9835_1 /TAXON_ID=156128 /ORGANISM="Nephroselmis pyriformis, Strain CCMP717" /LENGTH=133 /DNA_ID=CAMNT_0025001721 /DNA_START=78 /DNA_END=476 /DNA_ORIENTATION=-
MVRNPQAMRFSDSTDDETPVAPGESRDMPGPMRDTGAPRDVREGLRRSRTGPMTLEFVPPPIPLLPATSAHPVRWTSRESMLGRSNSNPSVSQFAAPQSSRTMEFLGSPGAHLPGRSLWSGEGGSPGGGTSRF